MRRIILDTDPGVDDALAILLAAASPELRLEAVTVVAGNVGVDLGVRNALLALEAAASPQMPVVARGATRPLDRDAVDASHVHGEDGLGGAAAELGEPVAKAADAEAVEVILQTISYSPGEITVIAIGPLTNLAQACLADAGTVSLAKEIIVMGGALRVPGNATPAAEYNFYADPEAARILLGSGVPITLIGLDVTTQAKVEREEVAARTAASRSRAAAFGERVLRGYFAFREAQTGRAECLLHDPLAVAVAIDPSLVTTERHSLDVETDGRLTTGMLVADLRETAPRPSPDKGVDVAVSVDAERFRKLFLDRVFG